MSFVFSIPEDELYSAKLRDDAILKAYPNFKDISCASGWGSSLSRNYIKIYSKYVLSKVLRGTFLSKIFFLPRLLMLAFNKDCFERFSWIVNFKFLYLYALEDLTKDKS